MTMAVFFFKGLTKLSIIISKLTAVLIKGKFGREKYKEEVPLMLIFVLVGVTLGAECIRGIQTPIVTGT